MARTDLFLSPQGPQLDEWHRSSGMPEDGATDKALLATATESDWPWIHWPLNAKWAVMNDLLGHLQLCFHFSIWAVKEGLLLQAPCILIQRDNQRLCSKGHYHPITWLDLIYHYSEVQCLDPIHWPSDSRCHFLCLCGARMSEPTANT